MTKTFRAYNRPNNIAYFYHPYRVLCCGHCKHCKPAILKEVKKNRREFKRWADCEIRAVEHGDL